MLGGAREKCRRGLSTFTAAVSAHLGTNALAQQELETPSIQSITSSPSLFLSGQDGTTESACDGHVWLDCRVHMWPEGPHLGAGEEALESKQGSKSASHCDVFCVPC